MTFFVKTRMALGVFLALTGIACAMFDPYFLDWLKESYIDPVHWDF